MAIIVTVFAIWGLFSLWTKLNSYLAPPATGSSAQVVAARTQIVDEFVKVIDEFVKVGAGIVVALGALFAGLTYRLNRSIQTTERFAQAIEQLGAVDDQGNPHLELRLGGIYTLERISRDSERDYWPIMEVLTAYVREHARWSQALDSDSSNGQMRNVAHPAADIRAVLTVIRRRNRWYGHGESQPLDLHSSDLRNFDFSGVHLERVW